MMPHEWRETGRREEHAFVKLAIFVRCARCGQNGFRKPNRRVIYTWTTDHCGGTISAVGCSIVFTTKPERLAMSPQMRSAHAQDNEQEDQNQKDDLGRLLPQKPTELSDEEAERIRKQGEESAATTQAINEGRMKPGDDPEKLVKDAARNPRAFESGVDKPHGGGTPELESLDRAHRAGRPGSGVPGQPGPRPNPNNPDDPTNPASTAHRGEAVLDGDARRAEYGGVASGQVGAVGTAASGQAASTSSAPVERNTDKEQAEKLESISRGQGHSPGFGTQPNPDDKSKSDADKQKAADQAKSRDDGSHG